MRLSALRKVGVLLVPWGFLCVFAALYLGLLWPRLREGQLAALCIGGFAALVFVSFVVAAVTFSRDVLLDHWPE
jgi:Na+/proline symporter